MTRTIIVAALRLLLSLAIAGPAQAWPGQPGGAGIGSPSGIDCAWRGQRMECDTRAAALVRKHAPAHPHIRKAEHAASPLPPTRLPDREEDPFASMHFE
ncbi:hypothetical protein [Bradyrhizobium sp. McL0616]|uniref:hypothetical protein n=1 Tax=Bradyrhizobium sp. McL0616 TaxID=3415674 RepID=UPI003CE6F75A